VKYTAGVLRDPVKRWIDVAQSRSRAFVRDRLID
jgi:hypothetical protein